MESEGVAYKGAEIGCSGINAQEITFV